MQDDVRRWRPEGRVYFWFETDKRQGDGWHLAADEAGCRDLEALVALGKASPYPARFSLPLGTVSGVKGEAVTRLLIACNADWLPDHWQITRQGKDVIWELGMGHLEGLLGVAADLRRGELDHAIGGDAADQRVWLWWPPSS